MSELFVYTKVCSVCGKEKGLCDFVTSRGRPQARCMACNNKQAKNHYRKSVLCSDQGSPWFTTLGLNFRNMYPTATAHF